jgi:hypothetical protein
MRYLLCHALNELYPSSIWQFSEGVEYNNLQWMCESAKPEKSVLECWVQQKNKEEPMRLLRLERNKRLDECRYIIEKAFTMGKQLPQEWQDYMQSLRDLPNHSEPSIDLLSGNLEMHSINWPHKPKTDII